ncbi:MAG: ATP synthase F1 subunit delta [Candidatus Comchoanobacterales bacterium]
MHNMGVALIRPYVQALFHYSKEQECLTLTMHYLSDLVRLAQHPDVSHLIQTPGYSISNRISKIQSLICGINPLYSEFNGWLAMFIKHKRFNMIDELQREYQNEIRKDRKELKVTLSAAYPLSDAQTESVLNYLKMYRPGWTINIDQTINTQLLSGISVQFDDNILDLSLASGWKQLKSSLMNI